MPRLTLMTQALDEFDSSSTDFFEKFSARLICPTVTAMSNEIEWAFAPVDGSSNRYHGRRLGDVATWRDLIDGLQHSSACRMALTAALRSRPETQVFWETPALTAAALDDPFEFVVTSAPLDRPADPAPFARYLNQSTTPVVTFTNLGGDATLVVPADLDDGTGHNYLLSFLRTAGDSQLHAFWQAAGAAIDARVDDRPLWVSTSGGGVAWLHLRLDDRPKYYVHAPYRTR